MKRLHCTVIIFLLIFGLAQAAIIDTYIEDFDTREDNVTISGIDSWSLEQGLPFNNITQSSTTYSGSGKSLKLTAATPAATLFRSATYGDISPCWIEYIVKPGLGAQTRSVPSADICAVSFDYKGKIYASDGSFWVDTAKTFSSDEWYRVILKLNFSNHLYDFYIEPLTSPKIVFVADKQNLKFSNTSINSLSQIGFAGVYNASRSADTYIDDLIVHFIDRLEIISATQTIMENKPSSPIIVQLQNSRSMPQTAWRDVVLELKSTSAKGEFSLDTDNWKSIKQTIIPKNAQTAAFYYKDATTGKPIITVKEYPDRGWKEASQQLKIVSKPVSFDISVTTPQVAGESFNVTVIAKDEDGNINEFYNAEIEILVNYINPLKGTKKIIPEVASGFNKGRLELSLMYPDCGIIEIMVRDKQDPSKTGTSGQIIFIPASFTINADSPQIVSRPFSLSVSCLNKLGEITPNYQGPAEIKVAPVSPESISVGEFRPASISPQDFIQGIAQVQVVYNRWGTIKIEILDKAYPAQRGLSEPIRLNAASLLLEVEPPPSERKFFYVGEAVKISISLLDESNIPIPNYLGKVNISSTLGLSLPLEYQFVELDSGKHIFLTSVVSAGMYSVDAQERETKLKGISPSIEVKEATLEVISTFAPIGTTEVIVRVVDEQGNTIISENTLRLNVGLEEQYADSSASSPAALSPVTFNKGIAKVLVSNTQAETVTVLPQSPYDFKIKKGTVTFGRIAKTGLGTLMWRKIKE